VAPEISRRTSLPIISVNGLSILESDEIAAEGSYAT